MRSSRSSALRVHVSLAGTRTFCIGFHELLFLSNTGKINKIDVASQEGQIMMT